MPREVILHIGQPKTGTTSLQRRLAVQRESLLEKGINYPKLAMNDFNHRCLSPAIFGAKNYPPDIKYSLGGQGQNVVEQSKEQWKFLRKTFQQDRLILSGENFFYPLEGLARSRIRWFLSMGDRYPYRVLSYVRNPADRYLSFVQEQLKLVNHIMALKAYPFMKVLTSYEQTFGQDFNVRLYDKELLKGSDVLEDFKKWLGDGDDLIDTQLKTEKPNISLTAEAMYVLTRLQGRRRGKTKSEVLINRKKLNSLRQLDRKTLGGTKPELKPDAKAFVEQNSPELLQLREVFDLSFPSVDYERINSNPKIEELPVKSFNQICDFDKDRSELLIEGLKRKFTAAELNLAD